MNGKQAFINLWIFRSIPFTFDHADQRVDVGFLYIGRFNPPHPSTAAEALIKWHLGNG